MPGLQRVHADNSVTYLTQEPLQAPNDLAVRDDGLIAIGGWSRTILWNYRTGERAELRYEADRATPESMEFSRDGSQLLMSRDLLYELWSVAERRRLRKWPQRGTSVEFSGDSRFVIEAGDGIQLFETATGKPASSRTFLEGGLTGAILTPDHSRVFAGEWLWDRVSGRRLGTSLGAEVYAFSPDGEQLAASIDDETYIIDVPDGDPADAPYLAAVAELIGGWLLDDAGQLRRRPLKMRTLAQLRALALPPDASDEARKVAAWLTQDRGTRGANPWTRQTLADVISRCKERMSVKPNGCAPVSRYIPDPSI
jgi:WD40 repeat protein